ncbi:MAG TPA: Hpt domain-containing protein [Xanthobacteraceae bacterium]|nr:Hpt domain-containing protein [Xanthobacteraceae bacterium]
MTNKKKDEIEIARFADHVVITQPNPLRAAVRRVDENAIDDTVARAEEALAELSGEFENWMESECARLAAAYQAIERNGFSPENTDELFRAAHDIKGAGATFGFPTAAHTAESLCRLIEHAPKLSEIPDDLLGHHVNAIAAIVRENQSNDKTATAEELSGRLRRLADEFLTHANRDRPEHLEAVLAPRSAPEN